MATIQPARLKAGVDVDDIPTPDPTSAGLRPSVSVSGPATTIADNAATAYVANRAVIVSGLSCQAFS